MMFDFCFVLASLSPIVSFDSKVRDHSQRVGLGGFFLVFLGCCLDASGKLSFSVQAAISS